VGDSKFVFAHIHRAQDGRKGRAQKQKSPCSQVWNSTKAIFMQLIKPQGQGLIMWEEIIPA
jgi:hypothetical protein